MATTGITRDVATATYGTLRKKLEETVENDAHLNRNFYFTKDAKDYFQRHQNDHVHPEVQTAVLGTGLRKMLNARLEGGRRIEAEICMTTTKQPAVSFELVTPGSARKGWGRKDSRILLDLITIPGAADPEAAKAAMKAVWPIENKVFTHLNGILNDGHGWLQDKSVGKGIKEVNLPQGDTARAHPLRTPSEVNVAAEAKQNKDGEAPAETQSVKSGKAKADSVSLLSDDDFDIPKHTIPADTKTEVNVDLEDIGLGSSSRKKRTAGTDTDSELSIDLEGGTDLPEIGGSSSRKKRTAGTDSDSELSFDLEGGDLPKIGTASGKKKVTEADAESFVVPEVQEIDWEALQPGIEKVSQAQALEHYPMPEKTAKALIKKLTKGEMDVDAVKKHCKRYREIDHLTPIVREAASLQHAPLENAQSLLEAVWDTKNKMTLADAIRLCEEQTQQDTNIALKPALDRITKAKALENHPMSDTTAKTLERRLRKGTMTLDEVKAYCRRHREIDHLKPLAEAAAKLKHAPLEDADALLQDVWNKKTTLKEALALCARQHEEDRILASMKAARKAKATTSKAATRSTGSVTKASVLIEIGKLKGANADQLAKLKLNVESGKYTPEKAMEVINRFKSKS